MKRHRRWGSSGVANCWRIELKICDFSDWALRFGVGTNKCNRLYGYLQVGLIVLSFNVFGKWLN